MMIINADDWGRSRLETDRALECYHQGRITSVTAMVFMEDSCRAAELAQDAGIDVGLHVNLSEPFTAGCFPASLQTSHQRIVHFMTRNKYSFLLYHPILRQQFRSIYQAQVKEFIRLYGKPPSHIDGHHHKHLCTNMLLDNIVPAGEKIRRNFSFGPGDKSFLNRMYRQVVDQWLAYRYHVTDYFFALSSCLLTNSMARVVALAQTATVEIMAHPVNPKEYTYLMSDDYGAMLCNLEKGTYSSLRSP